MSDLEHLSRKERERNFRRASIVDAARSVFAERGFSSATLDEIAERAEFGKGTLYNYFQNKEEIFDAVVHATFDEMIAIVRECCGDDDNDIEESFRRLGHEFTVYLADNASLVIMIMRELHHAYPQSPTIHRFPELIDEFERPLKRAYERGRLQIAHTRELANLYLSMIIALFRGALLERWACSPAQHPPNASLTPIVNESRILEVIERTFFHGILAPDPATPIQPLPAS